MCLFFFYIYIYNPVSMNSKPAFSVSEPLLVSHSSLGRRLGFLLLWWRMRASALMSDEKIIHWNKKFKLRFRSTCSGPHTPSWSCLFDISPAAEVFNILTAASVSLLLVKSWSGLTVTARPFWILYIYALICSVFKWIVSSSSIFSCICFFSIYNFYDKFHGLKYQASITLTVWWCNFRNHWPIKFF